MTLPEIIRRNAEKLLGEFCERDLLSPSGEEIRLAFVMDDSSVTLYSRRRLPSSDGWTERAVARLVYHAELSQWTLHYPDSSGRWCFYLNAGPALELGKLLRHLEDDPLGIFPL
jgi:hypothetical protein